MVETNSIPKMSSEIAELVKALSIVQSKLIPAKKSEKNPFFHSTYSSLVDVWDNCRALLHENGFAVIQTTDYAVSPTGETALVVITTLAHTSGQFISGTLRLKPVKDDPQSIGSAMSYGRRYGLAGIVGVVAEDEDDDAESAMGREAKTKYKSAKTETSASNSKQFGNTKPPLIEPTKPDKAETRKPPVSGASSFAPKTETDLVGGAKHYFSKDVPAIREVLKGEVPTGLEEIKAAWLTLCKAWI